MAAKRRQDEEMLQQIDGGSAANMLDNSQGSSTAQGSSIHISRGDLKGVINENSTNFESSLNSNTMTRNRTTNTHAIKDTSTENSQISNHSSKLTSNIDSIYGFYKKKDGEEDDEENSNIQEVSRNTSNFDNTANMGNYVPANQMLDLRLLNAEINASVNSNNQYKIKDERGKAQSGKTSRSKNTGEKGQPIEIFSFKQTPSKRNYQTLNQGHIWNADPLNKKYGLELTAEEKYGEQSVNNFAISRKGQNAANRVIGNEFDAKEEGSEDHKIQENRDSSGEQQKSFGMVYSNRPTAGPAGVGRMAEYAQTGIYIDPNQITKKVKPKKKQQGKDIKYHVKDMEAASFMGMDDFMGGCLPIGKKAKPQPGEEVVEDQISEIELKKQTEKSLEEQAIKNKRLKRGYDDHGGMPSFQQNVVNRNNLQMLETQESNQAIHVFYKDLKYPLYDLTRICPAPYSANFYQTPMKSNHFNQPISQIYRNYLIESETERQAGGGAELPENTDDSKTYRVKAIERRYGMTSLVVQHDKSTKIPKFSKIILNPVFHDLKIWQGDKIELSGDFNTYPLNQQARVPGSDSLLDEDHIEQIIFAQKVVNLSMRTDIDTNTDIDRTDTMSNLGSSSVRKGEIDSELQTLENRSVASSQSGMIDGSMNQENKSKERQNNENSMAENLTDSEMI